VFNKDELESGEAVDSEGNPVTALRYGNLSGVSGPEGLFCDDCGATIIEPSKIWITMQAYRCPHCERYFAMEEHFSSEALCPFCRQTVQLEVSRADDGDNEVEVSCVAYGLCEECGEIVYFGRAAQRAAAPEEILCVSCKAQG
jgi:RNA polymerase-binding transcription factor DksA